jgi:hypothetical protein
MPLRCYGPYSLTIINPLVHYHGRRKQKNLLVSSMATREL